MVLNELGQSISKALASMNNAETIDDKVLDACLKDICTALLQADINVKLVMNLRSVLCWDRVERKPLKWKAKMLLNCSTRLDIYTTSVVALLQGSKAVARRIRA